MSVRWIVTLGAVLAACPPAFAADFLAAARTAPAPQALWQGPVFSIAPYLWAANVTGDAGRRGHALAHLDYDFSKIIDNMNFAAMGLIEARLGRYSVSSDLIYLRISDRFAVNRIGLDRVSVGVGLWQWTPLAGYAVHEDGRSRLELVAGARLWSVRTAVRAHAPWLGERQGHASETWVDAVGGLRGLISLNDRIFLSGWALGGGGGSDYMWDLMASVGYRFSETISASIGYRAEQVKFHKAGFTFDTTVQGPLASVQISF